MSAQERPRVEGPRWEALPSSAGLRVDLHTNRPGLVEMHSPLDHRLLVHLGPPARGFWRRHDVLYAGGDIDFIPAGLSETWEQLDAATVVDIQLTPSLLRRAADDVGLDPDRVGQEPNCQFRDPQIEHIARALDAERRTGYPSGLLYTESLGLALAARLLSPGTPPATPNRGLSTAQLRRVTDFVEDHLDQDLSLVRLAEVAGVSASHFKTLFRRSTGLPVHRYVIERRVERARNLLLERALPAGQVAAMAGFSHQSHMARWMRRILGVTPTSLVRDSL